MMSHGQDFHYLIYNINVKQHHKILHLDHVHDVQQHNHLHKVTLPFHLRGVKWMYIRMCFVFVHLFIFR